MSFKKYYFFWFLSIVIFVGAFAYFIWSLRELTVETAQEIAIDDMQRFAKTVGFDYRLLNGPELLNQRKHPPFGFMWTYSDRDGTVKLYVMFDKSGWSNVSFEGDPRRLSTLSK